MNLIAVFLCWLYE